MESVRSRADPRPGRSASRPPMIDGPCPTGRAPARPIPCCPIPAGAIAPTSSRPRHAAHHDRYQELVQRRHPRQAPACPRGAPFREVEIADDAALRDEMIARAGGRWTAPRIFIGEAHVGGCDDLYPLEREGRLDATL